MITYSSSFLRGLRKQKPLIKAIAACKAANIFHYRGSRGGSWVKRHAVQPNPPNPAQPCATRWAKTKEFGALLLNARSICNKGEELEALLSHHNPSFVGITETWLKSATPDSALYPGNFNVSRSDRIEGRGGGVCLLTNDDWSARELKCHDGHPNGIECNIVRVRLNRMPRFASALIFYTVYISPGLTCHYKDLVLNHISTSLEDTTGRYPNAKTILWGDFNRLNVGTVAASFSLKKCNSPPTRGQACLDQIWTDSTISNVTTLPPIGNSDHLVLNASIVLDYHPETDHARDQRWIRPHPQSAIDKCGLFLASTDWGFIHDAETLDDKYDRLLQFLVDTNDHFFPRKKITSFNGSKQWFNEDVDHAIRLRNRAHKRGDLDALPNLTRRVSSAIKSAKQSYYTKVLSNLRVPNPRKWFKDIKMLGGSPAYKKKTELPFSIDDINRHFTSRAGTPHASHPPVSQKPTTDIQQLHDYEVSNMLKAIDTRKSQPLFDAPAFLLKTYHAELAEPTVDIFNVSLATAALAKKWQTIEVLPIPKVRNPTTLTQLRPIVRMPIFLKVLDRFVATIVRKQTSNKIDHRQFGGQPGLSCTHYLVSLLDFIHRTLEDKMFVCIVTIDIEKAYESIDHYPLSCKHGNYNIKTQVTNWVNSFVTNLQQVVRLTGSNDTSNPIPITKGIPQGSSLAPTLYTIFTNDMPPNENQWCFVDDTTPASNGKTIKQAVAQSQCAIDTLVDWVNLNGLKVNAQKCHAMIIHPNAKGGQPDPHIHPLLVNGSRIDYSDELKILGVNIQDNLKWDSHVQMIASKANSRLFLLGQLTKTVTHKRDLTVFYMATVRPCLEYACPAWNSSLAKKNINLLERIQRRATLRISRLWSSTYPEILDTLSLTSLEDRRQAISTTFARTLYDDLRFRKLFPPDNFSTSGRTTRNSSSLATIRYRTTRMQRSPMPILTKLLNASNIHRP